MKAVRLKTSDDGSVMLFTLGWIVVALTVVLVVAAATQVHIQRVRLLHLADELALEAADVVDVDVYFSGESAHPQLSQSRAADAVRAGLGARADRDWVSQVSVIGVEAAPDGTATVTLGMRVLPLFDTAALTAFGAGIEVVATASARGY
jgi:hypothetical protein